MSKSTARRLEVQLPPGSDEAVKKGCLCPIMDNERGMGGMFLPEGQYVINGDCPLHGLIKSEERK